MGTDTFYLLVVPMVLAFGYWHAAHTQKKRYAALTGVTGVMLLSVHRGITKSLSFDRQGVINLVVAIVLPSVGALGGWKVGVTLKRAWLVPILALVGFFLGLVLGVNVWLQLGYSL